MKISGCMIVRNEEQVLERSVRSLQELVDEVVVLDTGSEDGTVALAESLGCRVLTGGDRMHKARARNQAQDAATGEWVVVLDADEQIEDATGLRKFLESTEAGSVYVRMVRVNGEGARTLSQRQMRCWRRGIRKYKYRAHEVPVSMNGTHQVARTDFEFLHYWRNEAWKAPYTLQRLQLDVEEHPDAARPVYYLGRQYTYARDWDRAVEMLEQYVRRFQDGYDAPDVWAHLATCYKAQGNQTGVLTALHQALAMRPNRREWWCRLAAIYYDAERFDIAAGYLLAAEAVQPPSDGYRNLSWYGSHFYDLLARALYKMGRIAQGKPYAEKAVELDPDSARLQKNLTYFEGKT